MYAEHTVEPDNRIELAYKGKREHFVTPNIPNQGYPGQTIKVLIPRGSSDTTMVRETQQLTFNLDLESSKDKARSVVPNVGRNLVAKKTLSLGPTELEVVENADIFDTYKDLYLTKKQRENMQLQGIQPENGLKARLGAKKSDGTDLTLSTAENALKKTLGNRFMIPLDFEYFKQLVSPYYLHEDLIVTIELNKPEKVMLCSGDSAATYTISDIALEYDTIIDPVYTEKVSVAQQNSLYPYTRVTRMSYQIPSKKDYSWLLDIKLQAKSLQGILLLFLEDRDDFNNKVETFYNPTIKKVNVTINGDPHQFFKGAILPRNMFPEICKKF